jgi:hypothetical protein
VVKSVKRGFTPLLELLRTPFHGGYTLLSFWSSSSVHRCIGNLHLTQTAATALWQQQQCWQQPRQPPEEDAWLCSRGSRLISFIIFLYGVEQCRSGLLFASVYQFDLLGRAA